MWSMRNRSPLVRIPDRRGIGTRCELRMPDPSANPYLALAVQLAAGLDGVVAKRLDAPYRAGERVLRATGAFVNRSGN